MGSEKATRSDQKKKLKSLSRGQDLDKSGCVVRTGDPKKQKRQPGEGGSSVKRIRLATNSNNDKGKGKIGASRSPEEAVITAEDSIDDAVRVVKLHKSVLKFNQAESHALFQSLCTPEDAQAIEEMDDLSRAQRLTSILLKAGLYMSGVTERLVKKDSLETAPAAANAKITQLETKLKSSEALLRKTQADKWTAEAHAKVDRDACVRMEAFVKAQEENVAERERLIAAGRKVLHGGFVELAQTAKELRQSTRNDYLELWRTHKISYQRQGAAYSRVHFINSPVGQEFLRIMHRDLLKVYVQTEEFGQAALKGFGVLVKEAIRVACLQMDVTDEQKAKLDRKKIPHLMNVGDIDAALGIDTTLPDEWWIPVMEKAAQTLLEKDNRDPSLPKERLYHLPYMENLNAEHLEELTLKRSDSIGSDLSEGTVKAIDEFCGPETIPGEGEVKGLEEVSSPSQVISFPNRAETAPVVTDGVISTIQPEEVVTIPEVIATEVFPEIVSDLPGGSGFTTQLVGIPDMTDIAPTSARDE